MDGFNNNDPLSSTASGSLFLILDAGRGRPVKCGGPGAQLINSHIVVLRIPKGNRK